MEPVIRKMTTQDLEWMAEAERRCFSEPWSLRLLEEMLDGQKVVKVFCHEEQAKADFKKLNEAYRDSAQKANFYSTMIMPVSGNLMNISYALTAASAAALLLLAKKRRQDA